jgi:hypothetical protein
MRKREIKTTLKIQRLEILVPGRRSLQVFASICLDPSGRFFGVGTEAGFAGTF